MADLGVSESPSGGLEMRLPVKRALEGYALPRDIDAAQECFIRAHALERREPGGGKWPFAGDGPWHLIQGEVGDVANGADWSDTLITTEAGKELLVRKLDSREPRPPLDAEEVAELALLRSWLGRVPFGIKSPRGFVHPARRIVWEATRHLHRGEPRPQWGQLKRDLQYPFTTQRMVQIYRVGLALAVCSLHGWPTRRAQQMAR